MGISPQYELVLRHDILDEIDGPTLRYTVQRLRGELTLTRRSRSDWPDRELLAERFKQLRLSDPPA